MCGARAITSLAMTEHVPVPHLADPTVLVTLVGPDHSGVSSRVLATIAEHDVEVVDLEQLVVRGKLVLSALVTAPAQPERFERELVAVAGELGLEVTFEAGVGDNRPRRVGRAQVTVIGHPLRPTALAALTAQIAAASGNIDRIYRLARYPVTALRMDVSGAEPDLLRPALAEAAFRHDVDIAVQQSGLLRHAQRLVVMDVDSTLIQGEVIEMIAAYAGCADEVAAVTESAMRGEIDFAESLVARVEKLAGVPVTVLDEVYAHLEFTPGARTMMRTLHRLGYRFALVSGGFTQIIERIAADLGVHYFAANELEVADGLLTGKVVGPIVDRAGKAEALRRFAADAGIPLASTVAIGDGANDLDMLAASGLGVAFNAKPLVRGQAETAVNVPYLDSILYLLGITREEVEAADAAD